MVITKTPFRISFFGGGTDYPVWYRKNGGAVLSTSINKYCYIYTRHLPPFFNYKYRIRYTKREEVNKTEEIQHPSVRACLNFMNFDDGIEMVHTSDIPAMSGIGSSSAFTVGFLNSLYALAEKPITKKDLALNAIHVEQDLIGENVGSQDQTAAAFGGFNRIDFLPHGDITVSPVAISSKRLRDLEKHLMLFFTGFVRNASDIAAEQIKNTPNKEVELKKMRGMVDEAVRILKDEHSELDDFGRLLHESWLLKPGLASKISNSLIDQIYDDAFRAGALGGKVLGAGGGGFVLFFVPPERRERVKKELGKMLHVPFNFENGGSQVLYHQKENALFV